ncbi:MAG: aromatic ring-hydroxylating dioxygenase subunit alpha [Terriglobia bacterium]|jgi:choline monooxygenase|nr:aromatic ring-hydroxylating dioxygenase subunit alpha [Terriglobia bacterium]
MTRDVNKDKKTGRSDLVMNPAIEFASTLPSEYYTDPKYLQLERKNTFWRTWQIVGRSEQVSKAGDYFTANLCGEPLLIVRDTENTLRGFYNVCRHRAGPPAEGCGSRKVFRCGYHGWTYGLDGRLLNAPEMDGTKDFRFEDFRLRSIRVEEWEGQVFVNLDDNAESLPESLRELPNQVMKFRFGEMRLAGRRDYHMRCNWKVYIDNYLEGYHLPSVHPSLNRELDYNAYVTTLFERHSLQTSPIRGPENQVSVERRYKQADGDMAAEYYWIFPNWMLNCYPDNVSLNIVLPTGPETCVAIFEWYFLAERISAAEETIKFSDEIQLEDGRICETVHLNLKSQSYARGRYSVKQEKCLHHFHRLYAKVMGLA